MKLSAPLHGQCYDDDIELAHEILISLDIALLKRVGPRSYTFYGRVPAFYSQVFPPSADGSPCNRPWDYSSMLEFFLEDAELFFERNVPGKILSGIWQEATLCDQDQALSAIAMHIGNTNVIIIRLLEDDFANRARILQKAREQLLEQRSMARDRELYKNKARLDELTSLLNLPTFMEILQKETTRSMTLGMDLAVLFIEIDSFFDMQQRKGEEACNGMLTFLANLLQQSLRSEDIIARYSESKFVVLAPFTTPGQAQQLGDKICKTVTDSTDNTEEPLMICIGCTAYVGGESVDNFIQRAELALYESQKQGKNTVRIR